MPAHSHSISHTRIIPCFVFCLLHSPKRWMINIYRCLIKVTIPSERVHYLLSAAPRLVLPPSNISALPSLPLIQHSVHYRCWVAVLAAAFPEDAHLLFGSSEEPSSAVWHLSCHLLAAASVTSALCSGDVATDSASSGDGLCKTGGVWLRVGGREFLVHQRFSRHDWTGS